MFSFSFPKTLSCDVEQCCKEAEESQRVQNKTKKNERQYYNEENSQERHNRV